MSKGEIVLIHLRTDDQRYTACRGNIREHVRHEPKHKRVYDPEDYKKFTIDGKYNPTNFFLSSMSSRAFVRMVGLSLAGSILMPMGTAFADESTTGRPVPAVYDDVESTGTPSDNGRVLDNGGNDDGTGAQDEGNATDDGDNGDAASVATDASGATTTMGESTVPIPANGTWGSCQWDIDVNGVLTIHAGTGAPVTINDGDVSPWADHAGQVTAVHTTGVVVLPAASSRLFQNMTNLTDISGLANFDTSNAKTMHSMFSGCRNLADLTPLSSWNTTNIQNLGYMFTGCWKITTLEPLASWRLPKAYHLQGMFQDCYELTDISATADWELGPAVIQTGWMFRDCHSLSDISALASWRITRIQQTSGMFQSCFNITSTAPLKDWGTSELTNMSYMFYGLEKDGVKGKLTDLSGLAGWDVRKVVSMTYLFADQPQLQDLSPLEGWDTSSAIDMNSLFMNDAGINDLSALSGWRTGNVTGMDRVFQGCGSVSSLEPLASWDTSKVKTMMYMFYKCGGIGSLEPLRDWKTVSVQNMMGTFGLMTQLTSLAGLEDWNVSSLVYMGDPGAASPAGGTFNNCSNLTDISALRDWKTVSVQNMRDVFSGCSKLVDISPLSNWEMTSVTRIDGMFLFTGIQNVDALSKWDVSNVNTIWGTFYNCPDLTNIDGLSEWNTSSLVYMSIAFTKCRKLENVDALASWDTSKVTDARDVFNECSSLRDTSALQNWNLNAIVPGKSTGVFKGCSSLELVGVPTPEHNGGWLVDQYAAATSPKNWTAYDWAPVNRDLTSSQVQAGYTGSNSTITDVRVWRLGVRYWGTCPWWVDDEGTLHINDVPGEGTGTDVADTSQIPWWAERRSIRRIATQGKVVMPELSVGLFREMPNLTEVPGLNEWDSSRVRSMASMFNSDFSLQDLTGIEDWNVSQVEDMNCMFFRNMSLMGIESLSQWDTVSLTNTHHMFQGTVKLRSLRPLSSWKMGGVTTMRCMFEGAISLVDLDGLEDWDVSNVTDMAGFVASMPSASADNPNFNEYGPSHLVDVSSLEHWNVSNVHNFTAMFAGARITDTDALEHWDVHSGTTFQAMFTHCDKLADTSALASWKMDEDALAESSNPMSYMFRNCSSIVRAGVPAVGKGASYVAPAYPDRNWTDEMLPITPLKDSAGIYPYMTSNTEGRDFTDSGGVFIPYQPVYIVTYDANGASREGELPSREWAYVDPSESQSGTITIADPMAYDGMKVGYHFAGWSMSPDGSTGIISTAQPAWRPTGDLSTGDPSRIVLYAVWEANATSTLPSTGSRDIWMLLGGMLSTIGLFLVTGRIRRPRHAG